MFRTRDFILYFTSIMFLLMVIGFSLAGSSQAPAVALSPATDEITDVHATVGTRENEEQSRAERLARLKEKVANSQLVTISEPVAPEEVVEVDQTTPENLAGQLQLCPQYQSLSMATWSPLTVQKEESEGARVYFSETTKSSINASSSPTIERTVLLQTPVLFVPNNQTHCIPSDVVGIALDGSLIRNTESDLYGIFNNASLLGYALDGFPIYGRGTDATDQCGGRIVLGQYRYELSASRDTVLNCFSSQPQSFVTGS